MQNQYYRNSPTRHGTATPPTEAEGQEAVEIIRKWKSDPAIRAEFGQFSTFAAWYEADKAGKIRVLGGERKK